MTRLKRQNELNQISYLYEIGHPTYSNKGWNLTQKMTRTKLTHVASGTRVVLHVKPVGISSEISKTSWKKSETIAGTM